MFCAWTACKTLNIYMDSCGFDKIDRDYWFFPFLKMCIAMSEMSVGEKKKKIDCELMDLQVMFFQEDCSQCTFFFFFFLFQNVTTVSLLLPGAKTDIGKFAYTCHCKNPIRHWDAKTIPKFKALRQWGETNAALGFSYKASVSSKAEVNVW